MIAISYQFKSLPSDDATGARTCGDATLETAWRADAVGKDVSASTSWIFRAKASRMLNRAPPRLAREGQTPHLAHDPLTPASTVISQSISRSRSTGATAALMKVTCPSGPSVQIPMKGSGPSKARPRPCAASDERSAARAGRHAARRGPTSPGISELFADGR